MVKIKDRVCEKKPSSNTTFTQIVDIALAKENHLVNEADQENWIKSRKERPFCQNNRYKCKTTDEEVNYRDWPRRISKEIELLPRIVEIFQKVSKGKEFSKIDLSEVIFHHEVKKFKDY